MAAPDTNQHITDFRQEEPHLANTELPLENIDCNVEERSITPNHKDDTDDGEQQLILINGGSANETKGGETSVAQHVDHLEVSGEIMPPEPLCPDVSRCQEESSSSPQSDDRSERTLEHDQQIPEEAAEEPSLSALGDREDDQVDGQRKETLNTDNVTAQEEDEFSLEDDETTKSAQKIPDKDTLRDTGPPTQDTPEPPVPGDLERPEVSGEIMPPEPLCPDVSRCQEESSSSPQSDDRSERTLEHDQQIPEEAAEEPSLSALGDREDDQVDGQRKETLNTDNVTAQEEDEFSLEDDETTKSAQKIPDKDTLRDTGPPTQDTPEPPVPGDLERPEVSGEIMPPEPLCPDVSRCQEESSSSPQSDDRSERTLEHDQQIPEAEEPSLSALGDREDDQVDGQRKETLNTDNVTAQEEDEFSLEDDETTKSAQKIPDKDTLRDTGPPTQDTPEPPVPGDLERPEVSGEIMPPEPLCPDVSRCQEESSSSPQSDDRSERTLEHDQQIPEEAAEEPSLSALGDREDDQVDGQRKETLNTDNVTAQEEDEFSLEDDETTKSAQKIPDKDTLRDTGPPTQDTPEPPVPGDLERPEVSGEIMPPEPLCPDVSRCQEESSSSPQSDDRSERTLEHDQQIPEEAAEEPSLSALGDREDDQVDGQRKETLNTDNVTAQEEDEFSLEDDETTKSAQKIPDKDTLRDTGPPTQDTPEPPVPGDLERPEGSGSYLKYVGVVVVVVVAILGHQLLHAETPHQKEDVQQIDIFLRRMEKLKSQFPNQRPELWTRSKIHLLKHLRTAQPTEPVSLILTAGVKAERTLSCLAHGLASTFNASVLHIDGTSKSHQDSDQVKLDIDSKLQVAFEGDQPVAIIHRFEELPPGSTLIFYRYCDHENAAYKKTFLIFTVLLSEEEEIPVQSRLSAVEEMVDDHLQKKFLTDSHPISFDRMDRDKYGGLWSRISHLILPVAAERRTEHEGCPAT
ncbi:torsin-1A-interacting protein 2-like isoform X15 [Takifugu rubripes]|uniref:torsin-1A-interacting protein 2-like isoform X15 n=1 Tax=Takifugu rubripes TaxID=31033 RepID=UPI00114591EC|nr:torsin-1A-interacting protein 2-like isoform X15 [Takifugu rubripes]